MSNGSEALVKRFEDVRSWLSRPEVQNQLSVIVPSHINKDKILQDCFQVLRENNRLLDCTKQSLISVILAIANLGLTPKKELGQAHIVPFKNKGVMEATLIIGYRGYITLAKNSGEVSKISAHAVYSKDKFDYRYGTIEEINHVPSEGDRGELKGAYCVFFYRDGGTSFEYMDRNKLESIRKRSKASDDGPWRTDFEDMCVKSVIRHHAKYAPLSTEKMAKAAEIEDRYLEGLPQTDLLPELTEENVDKSGVDKFHDLLYKWLGKEYPNGFPKEHLESFIESIAKKNKVTVDVIKSDASNRFDQFAVGLKKHLDSLKSKHEVGQLGITTDKDKNTTISCPSTDTVVDISKCEKCPDKEGCPAIE